MDENQFWIACWKVIAAGVVCFSAVVGGCIAHTDYRISEAIKAGVDPLSANCALASSGQGTSCTVLASKK